MIPQYEPIFDRNTIAKDLSDYALSDGWFTEYKKTQEFEYSISNFLHTEYCYTTNNGTISLSIALIAAGVMPGDHVLVPNLTMIATVTAVQLIGAVPILVDVDDSLCMSVEDAEGRISPRTSAILYVTLNGRVGNADKIKELAKKRGLSYIEDDAQSLGSRYTNGAFIGTKADIASFSFSVPKIITTGQGGCLVTSDDYLSGRIRKIRDFGRLSGGVDVFTSFGINAKFTEMQAILGLSQMKTIKQRIAVKKSLYQKYKESLSDAVEFIPTDLNVTNPWFVDIYTDKRDELQTYLKAQGIQTRSMYPAIHSIPWMCREGEYPVSSKRSRTGLWLPSSMNLTDTQVDFIIEKVRTFYV